MEGEILHTKVREYDDEDLIDVVDSYEQYLHLHAEVSSSIAKGFWAMSVARKSAKISSPCDIRMDLDPNVLLKESCDGCYTTMEHFGSGNPMHMLCPLPPPALKKAQSEFQSIISLIISLEAVAKKICVLSGHEGGPESRSCSADEDGPLWEGNGEGYRDERENGEEDWTESQPPLEGWGDDDESDDDSSATSS